jgi:hypothetical protein
MQRTSSKRKGQTISGLNHKPVCQRIVFCLWGLPSLDRYLTPWVIRIIHFFPAELNPPFGLIKPHHPGVPIFAIKLNLDFRKAKVLSAIGIMRDRAHMIIIDSANRTYQFAFFIYYFWVHKFTLRKT